MLNCKDMTRLISDSLDRKISLRQRLELWMHIAMCGMCRAFRANVIALRKIIRETETPPDPASIEPEERLQPAEKSRILEHLVHDD